MFVGPSEGPGEQSFDVEACTPERLARRCAAEAFVDARHTVVTTLDTFTEAGLRAFLTRRLEHVSGKSWTEVAERLHGWGCGS